MQMKKKNIIIVFLALITLAGHAQVNSGLNLCLRDDKTGEWLIGLFDKFAVYDCECWDYQKVDTVSGDIELSIGSRQLPLKLTGQTLQIDGKTHHVSRLGEEPLPDYPEKDESDFLDNGYTGGKVSLSGCIVNVPRGHEDMLKLRVPDPLHTIFDDELPIETDSLGRFHSEFELTNTGCVVLLWNRLYLTPGNRYFVFVDGRTGQMLVMGEDARLSNEMLRHGSPAFSVEYGGFGDKTDAELLETVKEELANEQNGLALIESESPTLSKRYRKLIRCVGKMSSAYTLVQRRYMNRATRQCEDGQLWKWIHDNVLEELPRPYTLVQNNLPYVLDNYVMELLEPQKTNYSTAYIEATIDILQERKQQYSGAYQDSLVLLRTEMADYVSKADKGASQSELEKHPFNDLITAMAGKGSPIMQVIKSMEPQERVMIRNVGKIDQLDLPEPLKDLSKAVAIHSQLEQSHSPLSAQLRDVMMKSVASSYYRNKILQRSDLFESLAAKTKTGAGSLMPNEPLDGLTDGKAILDKILEPYRGRVVYLDVWGTWCVPCKVNLREHTRPVKDALADLPVTYLYLCNNSSDKAWRSVIAEYDLTGPDCVHYNLPASQQAAVEEYLKVDHFPTYLLFSPEGALHPGEIKPYNLNELRHHVEKLLGKTGQ